VKITVAGPVDVVVSVVIVVPGASGCSGGGPAKLIPLTDIPPIALAVQLSSAAAGNCTTIR